MEDAEERLAPKAALTPAVLFLFSTLLYFIPYALGSVELVKRSQVAYLSTYCRETGYVVFVIVACIVGAISLYPRYKVDLATDPAYHRAEGMVVVLMLLGLGAYVLATPQLFAADKIEGLESTNRIHLSFYVLSSIGLVSGYLAGWKNNKLVIATSIAGLLLALFIGHRSPLAVSILSIVYVRYRNVSLLKTRRLHVLAAVGALCFLALYKSIYVAVKIGNWDMVSERLLFDNLAGSGLVGMEQFITFKHLDYVVASNFHLRCSNLWLVPISVIPFADGVVDHTECDYNRQVQPLFFSEFQGVAANIWAEFFSNFGYLGIPCIVAIVACTCLALEAAIGRLRSPMLKASLVTGVLQFTFYIQRNEFFIAFGLAKRAIIVAGIAAALAYPWTRWRGQRRGGAIAPHNATTPGT